MIRRIKTDTNLRKKKINNDWITTRQIRNKAPVKKEKKNSLRNIEINKTNRLCENRFSMESNYCVLEIFRLTYFVLVQRS